MPVTLEVDPAGIARLTLDRSAKRNALDNDMIDALAERVGELKQRPDVRVVIVRGAGGTFCAGADIADWVDPGASGAMDQSRRGTEAFDQLAGLPQVTVAVIEGTAVGGGFELALACDLRIAADDALLGLPELGLANLPSWGGVARLVDVAGLGVARHLLLSSELIEGRRAAGLLVVTSAHPSAELDHAVDLLVERLAAAEPIATAMAKELVSQLERRVYSEASLAGFFALYAPSHQRKQDFLDQKAAARAARVSATTEGPNS